MAKLEIITGEKNPILRAVSKPIKKFSDLKKLAKQMKVAMVGANGLGIAAPQVGKNIRMFIIALNHGSQNEIVLAMVNPEIKVHSEEVLVAEEGCLSLPGQYGKVERFKQVRVKFFDLDGGRQILELSDLNARVIQHEIDHLDGVLFVDKMKACEKMEDRLL
jgi:peptide deformylase